MAVNAVGYLHNTKDGLDGERGQFYDYILAGNGLFIRAQNNLMSATIPIAPAAVRGLAPLEQEVRLPGGKIESYLYHSVVRSLIGEMVEYFFAITWSAEWRYRLLIPPQTPSLGSVEYMTLPNTVVSIHSHGAMRAFFSSTDNRDEQGLAVYMVVGRLDHLIPDVLLRIGVYGYYADLHLREVFDV